MELLIPVINDLQTVFHKTGLDKIELPQIVVVGSQSCGKSSVLESLVKKSFLPRGTEIVTRCPVILQLNHSTKDEYCCFLEEQQLDSQKKFAFAEVQSEIERLTDLLAGKNKGISSTPIIIKVHSPHVTNLTVVDLPGVVKIAMGDQPEDIEEQVRDLIMEYIKNPNAIILAVSPANADIATSESIKLAREVDLDGERTLGVVTKLDLMDKGTDANNVLECKTVKLKLGMIGVVNRSQQDIIDNKTIEDALQYEEQFIAENYSHLKERMGSKYLATRLQKLLTNHIKKSLPDLKKRIDQLTEKNEATLDKLGTAIDDSPQGKMLLMVETINDFLDKIKKSVKERQNITDDKKQLYAVQIANVFNQLDESMKNNPKFLRNMRQRITKAIDNSVNIERFASVEDVFKCLVKQEIGLLEEPAIHCCDQIKDLLEKLIDFHLDEDGRFQKLNDLIAHCTKVVLAQQLKEAKNAIKKHLKIESEMIFSSDKEFTQLLQTKVNANTSKLPDGFFIDKNKSVDDDNKFFRALHHNLQQGDQQDEPPVNKQGTSFPLTRVTGSDVTNEVRNVEMLIKTYFNIIRRQVTDFFPKCIIHHLYECSIDGRFKEAIKKSTQGKEAQLVSEPEERTQRRIETKEMLKNLNQATDIISGIHL